MEVWTMHHRPEQVHADCQQWWAVREPVWWPRWNASGCSRNRECTSSRHPPVSPWNEPTSSDIQPNTEDSQTTTPKEYIKEVCICVQYSPLWEQPLQTNRASPLSFSNFLLKITKRWIMSHNKSANSSYVFKHSPGFLSQLRITSKTDTQSHNAFFTLLLKHIFLIQTAKFLQICLHERGLIPDFMCEIVLNFTSFSLFFCYMVAVWRW